MGNIQNTIRLNFLFQRFLVHLTLLSVLGLSALPSGANADTMDCIPIQNPDSRAWCMAMNTGNSTDCITISNSDVRSFCFAVLNSNRMDCIGIQNSDLRAQCFAAF